MLPEIDKDSGWVLRPDPPGSLADIDLRDASSSLANTCEALRLTLFDGDLDAARAVLRMIVDQVADIDVAAGQILQPMLTEALETPDVDPEARQRFSITALTMLRPTGDISHGRNARWVWLGSAGGDVEPLLVQLVAMLLDDDAVPARVLDGPLSIEHLRQLPVRPADVLFLSLPPVDDVAPLLRAMDWFHERGVPVVFGGRGIRDVPDLARTAGAHAGAWSVTDAVSQLLRVRGPLTEAESTALRMVADGYTNLRIAHELDISVSAVKARLESAYQRVNAADRAHAVAIALRNQWIR